MRNFVIYISLGILALLSTHVESNFLPLCESSEYQIIHQEFEHRDHAKIIDNHEHKNHNHIVHGEHYDENVFDLLLCYLTEKDHLNGSVKVEYFSPDQISNTFIPFLIGFSHQYIQYNLDSKKGKQLIAYYNTKLHPPPDLDLSNPRGPPSLV